MDTTSSRPLHTLFILILTLLFHPAAQAVEIQDDILIGRISFIEGELLRYVPENNDWVMTVEDTPFGLQDALYSGKNSRAEFILPNRTWLRTGEYTQIQMLALTEEVTTVDIASGTGRVYNRSQDAICKITTPFGYVVAQGDTVFDLYVGDESMEVVALSGNVDVVADTTGRKYRVEEDGPSLVVTSGVTFGNGTVDASWDDWNEERDRLWSQRLLSSTATSYLPEPLHDDSYVLEENGRWERVYYEGNYYDMWRPTGVDADWRPFTVGRWSLYYNDNCWVPSEPFGYLTHHYGSWVYINSFHSWYWLPPVRRIVISTPRFLPAFGWYPGRVAWMHHDHSIGWIPLAPGEIYYAHHPWGKRTVVIKRTAVPSLTLSAYRYLDQAIIIPRDHLYRGNRYTPHLDRNSTRTVIINAYQPILATNNQVKDARRFSFTDTRVNHKPHKIVLNRIHDNWQVRQNTSQHTRNRITQDLVKVTAAEPLQSVTTQTPHLSGKLVNAQNSTDKWSPHLAPPVNMKSQERQRSSFTKDRRNERTGRIDSSHAKKTDIRTNRLLSEPPAASAPTSDRHKTSSAPVPSTPPLKRSAVTDNTSARPGTPTQQKMQGRQAPVHQRAHQTDRSQIPGEQESAPPALPTDPGSSQPELSPQYTEKSSRQKTEEEHRNMHQQSGEQTRRSRIIPHHEQKRFQSVQETPVRREKRGSSYEDAWPQQQEAMRRRQLEQQRQQQETMRHQQLEHQRQQQETMRRQQLEQQRQQQEMMQRRQVEHQRQQQETMRHQQLEHQRQQQETMRRQQLEQQRQQQEMMQRQQVEHQRQQQETMRRQQVEQQRQQQEAMQRQQLEHQQQQQEAMRRQQVEQQRQQLEQQQQWEGRQPDQPQRRQRPHRER
ncbi:MAG: hypothetical protein GXY53_05985 [Desulfobulbus sp.]|nr:hypothetical protein [Desulfobulbus sp.]